MNDAIRQGCRNVDGAEASTDVNGAEKIDDNEPKGAESKINIIQEKNK